jgi:uncharacterized protein involved in exopolysaccharide biosynthesis
MTSLNQNNPSISMNDSDEISLKELIQKIKEWVAYLKTKWKFIIVISAIGGALGVTYAFISKPSYSAVMTFVLDDSQSNGGGMSGAMGLASSFGIDLGGSTGGGLFTSSNIIELMKSRSVIEKTLLNAVPYSENGRLENISLTEYYIRINKLRKAWESKPAIVNIQFPANANRAQFSLQQDSILGKISSTIIKNNLKIAQKDKKVSIISVEVKTENELFSKLFCEQLAKETSDFYIETKSKKSRLNVEILQKQTDSIRGELNGAITGVASAMDNVFNLNSALSSKTAPSKRRQVDVQANTAILTQLVAQLELAKVNLRKETPLIQVLDQPILPLEKEKVGKLKSLLLGGFLAGLLAVSFLIFKRLYRSLIT